MEGLTCNKRNSDLIHDFMGEKIQTGAQILSRNKPAKGARSAHTMT